MTQISREYILRIQKKQKGKTTVSNNGGGGGGGGASQAWVDANYIGKDFLAQAFTMSKNGVVVTPNDTDTGIDNVNVLVAATMAGAVTMGSTLSVTGATTMTGAVTMSSTLAVDGNITMGAKLVATQEWTDNNYVSIGYFSRLFHAYNGNTAVNPNDLTTTIDNIKAMFGFWTDFYISALGNGGQASSAIYLSGLADVDVTGVQNGQALVWNSTLAKWVPGTGGGGADMNTVWAALAASTSEQINASHLATALSGYLPLVSTTPKRLYNSYGEWGWGFINNSGGSTNSEVYFSHSGGYGIYLRGYTIENNIYLLQLYNRDSEVLSVYSDGHILASGILYFNQPSNFRRAGIIGTYDPDRAAAIWSMGDSYQIASNGLSFGNLYGAAYAYFGAGYTFSGYSKGHSFVWCQNGTIYAALGNSIWSRGGFIKEGSSSAYVLTGDGGHALISGLSVSYATSAGSATTAGSASRLTGDTSYTAWGQSFWSYGTPNNVSGDMTNVGDICLNSSKRIYGTSDIYIGDSNNSYWVKCEDICSSQGSSVWNIRRGGNATFANMLSNGYVTALSDIRQKDVIKDFALDVHAIANARMIKFTWKDKRDELMHVGGVAQEWQTILPESVTETEDGSLAMDYGVIALMSAISLARVTVNHEQRIAQLENEIIRLKSLIK